MQLYVFSSQLNVFTAKCLAIRPLMALSYKCGGRKQINLGISSESESDFTKFEKLCLFTYLLAATYSIQFL